MGGSIRASGYMGLVLFLGGIAVVAAASQSTHSSRLAAPAAGLALVGYELMVIQGIRVARRRHGWLSRLVPLLIVLCLALAPFAYVGISLNPASTAGA